MAANTILILRNYANFMLISEKTTGSIYIFFIFIFYFILFFFFASKEACPIVRQLKNITVKTAQAEVVKCAKTSVGSPRTPLVT